MPASLVLGPMLRFVSEREAVFWVETDRDCQVEVLGASERTFRVHDHHYALKKDQDERGREVDSLRALSHRMRGHGPDDWPDVLLLLGDQVYADEVSPVTSAFIEQRRDSDEEPGERVVDYEEYTRLYHEAWSEPSIRWLLSVVSGDDLRRPRRARRLEHVGGVGRGGSQAPLVERAHRGGADVVLGLPAHREPEPRGAGRGRAAAAREGRRRRRGGDAGRVRLQGRPRDRRRALELLPRPGRHAHRGDGLARGTRAHGGQPLDGGRRGVGLDRGARHRRLRPPAAGHLAALPAHARAAQPGGLERGGLRGRLGRGDEGPRGEAAPGAGPRALGGLPRLVREAHRAAARGRGRRARRGAGHDRHAVGRRPPRVRGGGGVPARGGHQELGLAGGVLPVPEPARQRGAHRDPRDDQAPNRGDHPPVEALRRRRVPPIRWRLTGGGPWFDNQYGVLTVEGRRIDLRIEKAVPEGDEGEAQLERLLDRRLA